MGLKVERRAGRRLSRDVPSPGGGGGVFLIIFIILVLVLVLNNELMTSSRRRRRRRGGAQGRRAGTFRRRGAWTKPAMPRDERPPLGRGPRQRQRLMRIPRQGREHTALDETCVKPLPTANGRPRILPSRVVIIRGGLGHRRHGVSGVVATSSIEEGARRGSLFEGGGG